MILYHLIVGVEIGIQRDDAEFHCRGKKIDIYNVASIKFLTHE